MSDNDKILSLIKRISDKENRKLKSNRDSHRKNYFMMGEQVNTLTVLFILRNSKEIILYDSIWDKRWQDRVYFPFGVKMEDILDRVNKRFSTKYTLNSKNFTFNRRYLLNYYLLEQLDLLDVMDRYRIYFSSKHVPWFRINYETLFEQFTGESFRNLKRYIDIMYNYFVQHSTRVDIPGLKIYFGFNALELKKIFQANSEKALNDIRKSYPCDIRDDIVGVDDTGLLINVDESSETEEIPMTNDCTNECNIECK